MGEKCTRFFLFFGVLGEREWLLEFGWALVNGSVKCFKSTSQT